MRSASVNDAFYGLHVGQDALAGYYTNASAEELPILATVTQAGLDEALAYPRRGSLAAGAGAGSSELAGAWLNAPVSRGEHVCGLRVRVRAGRVPAVGLRARDRTEPWRAREPEHRQHDQMSRTVVPVHALYERKRSSIFIDYSTVKNEFSRPPWVLRERRRLARAYCSSSTTTRGTDNN
jgi:hypothetical protein